MIIITTFPTRLDYEQWVKVHARTNGKKAVFLVKMFYLILGFLGLLSGSLLLILHARGTNLVIAIAAIVSAVIMFTDYFCFYKIASHLIVKANKTKKKEQLTFGENEITANDEVQTLILSYDKISNVYETRSVFFLLLQNNRFLTIPKRNIHDVNDFRSFIQNKAPCQIQQFNF